MASMELSESCLFVALVVFSSFLSIILVHKVSWKEKMKKQETNDMNEFVVGLILTYY